MVCGCVSKRKSWLLVLMTMLILMFWQTQGVCIEEERKALLEIKASRIDLYGVDLLPAWVDDGSTGGSSGDKCCDWERVTCSTITGHVTNLSLSNMMVMDEEEDCKRMWPLNVSLFLHFKELTSLNLSKNCLDDNIASTGLGRLSSLKKLQTLDLSDNSITNATLPSLGALTSLRVLNLGFNLLEGYFPVLALENLEILDLNENSMQGFERVSLLKELKVLKLEDNDFMSDNVLASLSHALPLLKSLDLLGNELSGPFPAEELSHLTNLEELDLSRNNLDGTPSIQDCKQLSSLKKLKSIRLYGNKFNKSIILCLSSLPFLRTLNLWGTMNDLEGSFPAKGMF